MHGFARNAAFWNRWVPAIAESRRIYRPDLLGCGASDVPAPGYHFTPEKIAAEILAVFAAMSLKWVHWVGKSSGGRLLHACSGCFRLEQIAGWGLHPLESAALSRRTPIADLRREETTGSAEAGRKPRKS